MHEALLKRSDVQGNREHLLNEIMVEQNCVNLHPKCHLMADTKEGQEIIVRALIQHCGYESIKEWLEHMISIMKSRVPEDALRLLEVIQNGNRSEVQSL